MFQRSLAIDLPMPGIAINCLIDFSLVMMNSMMKLQTKGRITGRVCLERDHNLASLIILNSSVLEKSDYLKISLIEHSFISKRRNYRILGRFQNGCYRRWKAPGGTPSFYKKGVRSWFGVPVVSKLTGYFKHQSSEAYAAFLITRLIFFFRTSIFTTEFRLAFSLTI
jgi:hypothetical protein